MKHQEKKQPAIFGEEDLIVNCLTLYERALQVEMDGLIDTITKKKESLEVAGEKMAEVRKALKLATKARDEALAAKKGR